MKDLDDPAVYAAADPAGVDDRLRELPEHCRIAYTQGRTLALPDRYRRARRVVIAGQAHAASAGALVQALYAADSPLPISVWRGYGLPAYATGPETLVVASSASGDADETLNAFETAVDRGCHVVAFTRGGELGRQARQRGLPAAWVDFLAPAHLAGLWQAFYLLGALAELWLIPDPGPAVEEAVALLASSARTLGPDQAAARNPAKRLAGQFVDRLPILAGAGLLSAVAQHWKLQLNHLAKTLAVCDEMPEANHSSLLGYERPDAIWQKTILIQLRGACDGERLSARYDQTTTLMLEAGLNQDTVRSRGESGLAQASSLAYFGDWAAYYTAVMAGVDPAPASVLERL
jgi:glucose/mannose-6-phosphate isomerase